MNGDIRREFEVAATAATVLDALRDVERVVSWVPIISDVEQVEEFARYRGVLSDRMGPFTMRADLDIKVDFGGDRVRLEGSGSDRQLGARISFDGDVVVQDRGADASGIVLEGSYSVSGRAAALGAGQITQKAEGIVDGFAERLRDHFAQDDPGPP